MTRGPENPSTLKESLKEYGGKALKYSGVVIGILGLLSLNVPAVVGGVTLGLYGRHVENRNKQPQAA